MDDKDIDRLIRNMDIPPAASGAKKRTADLAWARFEKAQTTGREPLVFKLAGKFLRPKKTYRKLFPSFSPAAMSACMIVIALFAALSYAVTQSTRSGGGDAQGETSLINSAQVTQYPAGVRTALVRMVIGGVTVDKLEFNAPADFANLTLDDAGYIFGVFHPDGGGATYQTAPGDSMADNKPGKWMFNAEIDIPNIGMSNQPGSSDLVAYLVGITEKLCTKTNEELGIQGIPRLRQDLSAHYAKNMNNDYVMPAGDPPDLDAPGLEGQPFGCFESYDGGIYVYYHVLLER